MTEDKIKSNALKLKIIEAGYRAVEELISVAEETIIKPTKKIIKENKEEEEYDWLAADRLKNAAAAKKVAIFDAFEILSRIEKEKEDLNSIERGEIKETTGGFAERKATGVKQS